MDGGLNVVVLLDTCALIWWTLDPREAVRVSGERACRLMERQGGFVSSISIWEIGIKVKKASSIWESPLTISFLD